MCKQFLSTSHSGSKGISKTSENLKIVLQPNKNKQITQKTFIKTEKN